MNGQDAGTVSRATAAEPSVWVVSSYRAGENSQLDGLARRLGLSYVKFIPRYRWFAPLLGLLRLVSPLGIVNYRELPGKDAPDLIICSGMKNEPFCRWLRRRSGGRSRIVFLGRTWAPADRFDLLVGTPQYRMRPSHKVIINNLTLHGVFPESLQDARERFAGRFRNLPRPLTAVLVGGDSGPHYFGPRTAARLARALTRLHATSAGTLFVSTSSRTGNKAVDTLQRLLPEGTTLYRWRRGDAENPYFGMLAHADRVVVTSDSVAMMSEAAATGSPVLVFNVDEPTDDEVDVRAGFYRLMMRYLPQRVTRDLALFHERFIAGGYGRWLGEAVGETTVTPPADEFSHTVARVRDLLNLPVGPVDGAPPEAPQDRPSTIRQLPVRESLPATKPRSSTG